ncbi:MAG: Rpn family recombination-promoting nuclease/putative transposase [Leptonema sp. (in: Bacteria)]|nr:Rpn family recombination-promoting nuclease/putative transposase [Leptonema sp. (in: bacteria)]
MNNNNHPHANFAASVFSNLTYTRQILKPLLPIKVSKNIDWKTLKLTDGSFVDAPHLFDT